MAGLSYSFVMTTIILWVLHYIPGCRMRCDEDTEILGVDDAEMGEFAYDYVGIDLAGSHDHEYHDDTHSHGALPATTGGREPRHVHSASKVHHDASSEEGDVEKRVQPVAA